MIKKFAGSFGSYVLRHSMRAMRFPSPSQVFQLPASFLAENGKVHVIVDIPIVPIRHYNSFDLYHYQCVPFLLGNQLVRVRSTDSQLAVNKDKSQFMEIIPSQLKGCLHLGKTVLCRYPGVIRAGAAQCCLRAVFEGYADAIFKTCQLTFIKSDFVLERLDFEFCKCVSDRIPPLRGKQKASAL